MCSITVIGPAVQSRKWDKYSNTDVKKKRQKEKYIDFDSNAMFDVVIISSTFEANAFFLSVCKKIY